MKLKVNCILLLLFWLQCTGKRDTGLFGHMFLPFTDFLHMSNEEHMLKDFRNQNMSEK